jgi:hypothetical protein
MGKAKATGSPRFGVYLNDDENRWLNETRGRFLLKYGTDITTTGIVRAALAQLRKMDEAALLKLLQQHSGRRRTR